MTPLTMVELAAAYRAALLTAPDRDDWDAAQAAGLRAVVALVATRVREAAYRETSATSPEMDEMIRAALGDLLEET